jgi:hypothetical protein
MPTAIRWLRPLRSAWPQRRKLMALTELCFAPASRSLDSERTIDGGPIGRLVDEVFEARLAHLDQVLSCVS